jgi:hypothetical protein
VPNPDNGLWKTPIDRPWQTGLWYKYLNNYKVYLCPVDIKSPTYTTKIGALARKNKLSSYVMNGASCGYPTPENLRGYKTCKFTDVWNPLCYLLWEPNEYHNGPTVPDPGTYNDGSNYPDKVEGLGALHSHRGGILLALDGHAAFASTNLFLSEANQGNGTGPHGKSLLFWSPWTADGAKN